MTRDKIEIVPRLVTVLLRDRKLREIKNYSLCKGLHRHATPSGGIVRVRANDGNESEEEGRRVRKKKKNSWLSDLYPRSGEKSDGKRGVQNLYPFVFCLKRVIL